MSTFNEIEMTTPYGDTDNVLELNIDSSSDAYVLQDVIKLSSTYTFSIWYRAESDSRIIFNVLGESEIVNSTTTWNKFAKTVTVDTLDETNIYIVPSVGVNSYFYEGYLVEGTIDTSWLPAPEDTEGEIGSVRSEFSQTAESILERVSASEGKISTLEINLEGIKGTVEDNTSELQNLKTQSTQNAEKIQLAATKKEVNEALEGYYTKEEADAAIEVKADEITQSVSSSYATKEEVSSLVYDNRNYALGSGNYVEGGKTGWEPFGSSKYVSISTYDGYTRLELIESSSSGSSYGAKITLSEALEYNGKYTLSMRVRMKTPKNLVIRYYGVKSNGNVRGTIYSFPFSEFAADEWKDVQYTFTYKQSEYECVTLYISCDSFSAVSDYIDVEWIKNEKGEKATNWSPAPEDVENTITEAYTSAINQKANSILTEVEGIYVTNDSLESAKASLELSIEKKVGTDELISKINASADEINLTGDRVVIDSTYFKLAADGTLTAKAGNIASWMIFDGGLLKTVTKTDADGVAWIYQYMFAAPSDDIEWNTLLYSRRRISEDDDWEFAFNLYYNGNFETKGQITADAAILNRLTLGGIRVPQMQHGSVDITPSATNTPTGKAVAFPSAFDGVPDVVTTPATTGSAYTSVASSTSTGCTVYLTRTTNTNTTTVKWQAMY